MSTLIQQIAALRTSLREADGNDLHSFSHVFDTFFDISDGSNLMGVSESVEAPLVHALLESTARRHLRDPRFALTLIQILHHVPSDLFHGGFLAGPITGTFFYFPADQQGLVAFNDGSPMTHFYRITATVLPAGGMPMPRPGGKQ